LERDVAANQMRLYLDGAVEASAVLTVTGTIKDDDGEPDPVTIGALIQDNFTGCGCPIKLFSGTIDEVGYYNRTLSAGEIRGNFTAGSLHRAPTGVQTISPTAANGALPTVSQSAIIDGYTQPGSTANIQATSDDAVLKVELNGTSAGGGVNGLTISAGNSTVRGLVINRFGNNGIQLSASGGNI